MKMDSVAHPRVIDVSVGVRVRFVVGILKSRIGRGSFI